MNRFRDTLVFLGTVVAGGVLSRVVDDMFNESARPKEDPGIGYERARSIKLMASLTQHRLESLAILFENELAETSLLDENLKSIRDTADRIAQELSEYEALSDGTASLFVARIQSARANSDLLRDALQSVREIREE